MWQKGDRTMFLSQLAQDEHPIDDYLSKKFSLLSFAAIFFVVFAHSCNWDFFAFPDKSAGVFFRVEVFFHQAVCRFTIPYFFFCSGFMMYASLRSQDFKQLFSKLVKRGRTLLIPWVLWLIFGMLFYWCAYKAINFIWNKNMVCDWAVSPEPVKYIFTRYVWNNSIEYLWYLKRLMLFAVLSPLFYFLIKCSGFGFLFVSCAAALTIDSSYLNDHFCWFIAGMTLSLLRINIKKRTPFYIGAVFFVLWIAMCFYCKGTAACYVRNSVGAVAVWMVYDTVYPVIRKIEKPLLFCASYTFFIYCIHIYPIFVYDLAFRKFCPAEWARFPGTLLLTMATSIGAGWFLKRFASPVYNVLTGDR